MRSAPRPGTRPASPSCRRPGRSRSSAILTASRRSVVRSITLACCACCSDPRPGRADQLRALHTTRLAMLLEKMLDTTVRGVVYEAAGTVDPAVLSAGAGVVATACERSLIPYVLLTADPDDHDAWTPAALDAVQRALLARGADSG